MVFYLDILVSGITESNMVKEKSFLMALLKKVIGTTGNESGGFEILFFI